MRFARAARSPAPRRREVPAEHAAEEYAKRVRDWPALETAVERKMEEHTEFVR